MKYLLGVFILLSSVLVAKEVSKEELAKQNLEEAMKKEQKYAKEQKFYMMENYDFSGAEVNPESVKKLKEIEVDDLDMDSVYD